MKLELILNAFILNGLYFQLTESENILFLSFPYYGHINPMVRVADQLTKFGHTSYISIPEKFRDKFSLTTKGVNLFIIEEFPELEIMNKYLDEVLRFRSNPPIKETFSAYHKVCDRYLLNDELFLKLKSFNASLVVVDAYFVSNCFAVFAYRLDVPFILQGVHNQINIHRTTWPISVLSYIPIGPAVGTSFKGRISNTIFNLLEYLKPAMGTPGRKIKDYAPERADISFDDLIRQAKLYVIDSDLYLNSALPALPNVKYIGGIALRPAMPLVEIFLDFVKASKNGVIVVSPGTVVGPDWDVYANKMAEAFSKVKYDVVWKQSNSSYSRQNILLTKWLPQNDLLAHPNTKLFITHCGNSGRYESLYHAVPVISFPVIADQFFNSEGMKLKGFGISMNLYNFTVDELVENIKEVFENQKYKKNIAKASELFRSKRQLPSEKVGHLINKIVKYGGDHLRSELQNIPLYQFFMLDILAVVFAAIFFVLFVTVYLARKCFAFVCRKKKAKRE